jgi:hypothetical protein
MRSTSYRLSILLVLWMPTFISCERDFDIDIKTGQPQLIVEGYINNDAPLYNYVVLSYSQEYYRPGFENKPVTGAKVTITEGTLLPDNTYQWDASTKKSLQESTLSQLREVPMPGFYFDTTLVNDPSHALKGTPGKHYLLEIETGGQRYSAITALLQPVPIDSLTSGFHFMDEDNDTAFLKARLTAHYKDPDTIGNTQMYFWRDEGNRSNFGWGGLSTNRYISGADDLVNGQDIHLTHSYGFVVGDTVQYFLASVERKVYNFWESFNKARNNGGPFATPVTLQSTIKGDNVIGCFSGFSISTKTIIIK